MDEVETGAVQTASEAPVVGALDPDEQRTVATMPPLPDEEDDEDDS